MGNENATNIKGYGSVDDIMRRILRVSDTKNIDEVATALLKLYPAEKAMIQQEVMGMPIAFEQTQQLTVSTAITSPTEDEVAEATDYLEDDIEAVINEPAFRNFSTNLKMFGDSIKSATEYGIAAARSAVDATERDKALGYRKTLSDYARLARFIGLQDSEATSECRRLARNVDWISSLILVLSGEAISKQALKGFLIQISVGELYARHDAIINALDALLGVEYSCNHETRYARGTKAYRTLYEKIENSNQQDLKPLLIESELSRMLTGLIDQIARDNVSGVSAFGPDAEVFLNMIDRLLLLIDTTDNENQPPLIAFYNELELFRTIIGGRNRNVGLRLIDISRPSILFYGSRYGNLQSQDITARQRLKEIIFNRNRLADIIDRETIEDEEQFILDWILSCIDRAIDLYTLGTEEWGTPELSASVYSDLIDERSLNITIQLITDTLKLLSNSLSLSNVESEIIIETKEKELNILKSSEERWEKLVDSVIPSGYRMFPLP